MKKLITAYLLFTLVACAHHKPIATPEEVNDYLDRIAERSNIDLLDRVNRSITVSICPCAPGMAPPRRFKRLKIPNYMGKFAPAYGTKSQMLTFLRKR